MRRLFFGLLIAFTCTKANAQRQVKIVLKDYNDEVVEKIRLSTVLLPFIKFEKLVFEQKAILKLQLDAPDLIWISQYYRNPKSEIESVASKEILVNPGDSIELSLEVWKDSIHYAPPITFLFDSLITKHIDVANSCLLGVYNDSVSQEFSLISDSCHKNAQTKVWLNFALKNFKSLAAVFALRKLVEAKYDSLPALRIAASRIYRYHSKHPLAKQMKEDLDAEIKLQPGNKAPNFRQQTAEGKVFTLKNFKGKYLLIDFWASWCIPCRNFNADLIKIHEKFAGDKFAIVGISLDIKNNRANWLKAIKQDKLPWINVTDFLGWKNKAAVDYNVSSIPTNYLISPEGIIIARDLRGEELWKKIEELVGGGK